MLWYDGDLRVVDEPTVMPGSVVRMHNQAGMVQQLHSSSPARPGCRMRLWLGVAWLLGSVRVHQSHAVVPALQPLQG